MKYCANCGKPLESKANFCDGCGLRIQHEQAVEDDTVVVVPVIQEVLPDEPVDIPMDEPVHIEQQAPPKKKKGVKKGIIFGAVGLTAVSLLLTIAVLVGAIAIPFLFSGSDKGECKAIVYLKEDQLYVNTLNGKGSVQLTEELFTEDYLESNSFTSFSNSDLDIVVSKDDKTFFFPDKIDEGDRGYSIYCKNISKKNSEAEKIDSEIKKFFVSDDSSIVTYTKYSSDEGDCALYQYNVKKGQREKIVEGCTYFCVSSDGKTVYFKDEDKRLYCKKLNKEKEKIASDAFVEFVSEDRKVVYFTSEGALYKYVLGKEKEKIDFDVHSVTVCDVDEVYYTKNQTIEKLSLADFVDDDLKAKDEAFVMPEYPDRPYRYDYTYYSDYLAAFEKYQDKLDEYEAAQDEYTEINLRNSLREALEDEVTTVTTYDLVYFNGKNKTVLADSVSSLGSTARDATVMSYRQKHIDKIDAEKLLISEISNTSEVKNHVDTAVNGTVELCFAVKNKAISVDSEDYVFYFCISDDGKVVYFYTYDANDEEYNIQKMTTADGKVTLYGKDVFCGADSGLYSSSRYLNRITQDNKLVYCKDFKDGVCDMYIADKRIESDVLFTSVFTLGNGVKYRVDYDNEDYTGTLKVYDGKKTIVVADDVYGNVSSSPKNSILYLTDYSREYKKGALHYYKDGKSVKIDDDVESYYYVSD